VKAFTSGNEETSDVRYEYDALDRRIRRKVDTNNNDSAFEVSERLLYDTNVFTPPADIPARHSREGGNPVSDAPMHELVQTVNELTGHRTHRFLNGPQPDMVLVDEVFNSSGTPTDILWLLQDHQNTVTDVATMSSTSGQGTLRNHLEYNAFGAITSQTNSTYAPLQTYTGQILDPTTGLLFYDARWYDPKLGRFVSEDPIGFAAGDANLSRYVGNSWPNGTDPTGMFPPESVMDRRLGIPTGSSGSGSHSPRPESPRRGPSLSDSEWVWFWEGDYSKFGEGYGNNVNPWGSKRQAPVDGFDICLVRGQQAAAITGAASGAAAAALASAPAGAAIYSYGSVYAPGVSGVLANPTVQVIGGGAISGAIGAASEGGNAYDIAGSAVTGGLLNAPYGTGPRLYDGMNRTPRVRIPQPRVTAPPNPFSRPNPSSGIPGQSPKPAICPIRPSMGVGMNPSSKPVPPFPGNDATKTPSGYQWKGKLGSTPGSKQGNYFNPTTGESLRPDLEHPEPIGAHWDYRDPEGIWWRIFPDGRAEPKL
jgi:RHS repeat-associated protein